MCDRSRSTKQLRDGVGSTAPERCVRKNCAQASDIVAYCRGPYCLLSLQAVAALRKRGLTAMRSEDGISEGGRDERRSLRRVTAGYSRLTRRRRDLIASRGGSDVLHVCRYSAGSQRWTPPTARPPTQHASHGGTPGPANCGCRAAPYNGRLDEAEILKENVNMRQPSRSGRRLAG